METACDTTVSTSTSYFTSFQGENCGGAIWIAVIVVIIIFTIALWCGASRWGGCGDNGGWGMLLWGIILWIIFVIILLAVVRYWGWAGLIIFIIIWLILAGLAYCWGNNGGGSYTASKWTSVSAKSC